MADYHDIKDVAALIEGIDFKAKRVGTVLGTGMARYHCTVNSDGYMRSFDIQMPPDIGMPDPVRAMMRLANNAWTATELTLDDFFIETGAYTIFDDGHQGGRATWEHASDCVDAYQECVDDRKWLTVALDLTRGEIRALSDTLSNREDDVRKQVAQDIPTAPSGFVTIEEMCDQLDVGNFGKMCTEYYESNIGDRFADVADNAKFDFTTLVGWCTYFDLDMRSVADAIDPSHDVRYKVSFNDLMNRVGYEHVLSDLDAHRDDICAYVTLQYLRSADGVYAMSKGAAFELMSALRGHAIEGFDKFSDYRVLAESVLTKDVAAALANELGGIDAEARAADELSKLKAACNAGRQELGLVDLNEVAAVCDGPQAFVNRCALGIEAVRAINDKGYDAALAECWQDAPVPSLGSETAWARNLSASIGPSDQNRLENER